MNWIKRLYRNSVFHYLILSAIFTAFVILTLHGRGKPMIDDAAIYFRYADQICSGHGIVYNSGGQHVYGASSLPYLFLLSLIHKLGLPVERGALLINYAAMVGVVLITFDLITRSHDNEQEPLPAWSGWAACAAALCVPSVFVWVAQGLECGTHLFVCMLCVWLADRGKQALTGAALALALMSKLDAATLVIAILRVELVRTRRFPAKMLVTFLASLAPWLLFTKLYFGSPVPMSLQAKLHNEFSTAGHGFLNHYRQLLSVLVVGLSSVLLCRQRWVQVSAVWFVLYVLVYDLTSRGYPFPWYFFTSDYLLYMLAAVSLCSVVSGSRTIIEIARRFVQKQDRQSFRIGQISGIAAILLATMVYHNLLGCRGAQHNWRAWAESIETDRHQIGQMIHDYASPGEKVVSAFGWIQYLSSVDVYDPTGINDLEFLRIADLKGKPGYEAALSKWGGNYVTYFTDDREPVYQKDYVAVAVFKRTLRTGFPQFTLWARRGSNMEMKLRGQRLPLVYQ